MKIRKMLAVGVPCALILIALILGIFFLSGGQEKMLESAYPTTYSDFVEREAAAYDLDPYLVYALIKTESNFDPEAVSRVGARGLMQLMPSTFEWLLTLIPPDREMTEEDLLIPEINIRYGCKYLALNINNYSQLKTAICAYNAGFGVVDGWLKDPNYSSDGENLDYIPYGETEKYAEKVLKAYDTYRELYAEPNSKQEVVS